MSNFESIALHTRGANREPLYTVRDVAELIGISASAVHNLLRRGKMPDCDGVDRLAKGSNRAGVKNWKRSTIMAWIAERNAK